MAEVRSQGGLVSELFQWNGIAEGLQWHLR
jgi:hypothetical protein